MQTDDPVEVNFAQGLPAWTRLKVRTDADGWRSLTAREICILADMFQDYEGDEEFQAVGRTLGLVDPVDESSWL